MTITRRFLIGILAASVPVLSAGGAFAAGATVNVSLWDKGGASMDGFGTMAPMGMAMQGVAMMGDLATMGVDIDVAAVPAGDVTFVVTNASKETIHEMLVAPIVDEKTELPYDPESGRVDEEAAHHLGEVSELDPGQSGSLTLTLEPGKYILFCNIAGHFAMGMWTVLDVAG